MSILLSSLIFSWSSSSFSTNVIFFLWICFVFLGAFDTSFDEDCCVLFLLTREIFPPLRWKISGYVLALAEI